jgi:hypothetical protein
MDERDAKMAIDEIDSYFIDQEKKTFFKYRTNLMLKSS